MSGGMVLSGPAARAFRVELEGTLPHLRIRLPSMGAALDAAGGLPVRTVARTLARLGASVSVSVGRVPLARLGDADRPIRLHVAGVLLALVTVSPAKLWKAGRALGAT